MKSRRIAVTIALLLVLTVIWVDASRGATPLQAIRNEFGTGPLAGCMAGIAMRESRMNARAANWTDRHADGSRGSFGLFQIGALWRDRGESVAAFARRMYDPAVSAALAHRIYRRYGLAPWGNRCT